MAVAIAKVVASEGYQGAVARWEDLLSKHPDYQYDRTGRIGFENDRGCAQRMVPWTTAST